MSTPASPASAPQTPAGRTNYTQDVKSTAAYATATWSFTPSLEMDLGARFEFTQEQFDPICSDLQPMKIARAVAASSAFPILLTPITLRNYATPNSPCGYQEPVWVANAMQDQFINPSRFRTARFSLNTPRTS